VPSDQLVDALARYRQGVAGRYRAIKPSELGDLPPGELWLSPKIDGELAVVEFRDGTVSCCSRRGRAFPNGPLMLQLHEMAKRSSRPIRMIGELHCLPDGDGRARVGDVSSAFAGSTPLCQRLAFAAFDVVDSADAPAPVDYDTKLEAIRSSLAGIERATCVPTVRTADRLEIRGAWQQWGLSGKAEGIIARTRDGRVYKVKPDISIDAVVMAFTTRCDAPTQVRSVLLGLALPDGTYQLIGGLGGVGGATQREELYESLRAHEVKSALRQPSSDGGIFRFLRPVTVAEVNCTDVQSEDSAGAPIQRWIMRFDGEQWRGVNMALGVSLLHPQFVRIRTDKSATPSDAGLPQLAQRCAPPDRGSAHADAAGARLLMRRVWTKAAKDKMAVRKVLAWSTGRSGIEGWPAWIVHLTDYSPDRKTPLERTFRAARTQQEAEAIAERLIAENIKKGWDEVQ
jgi:ATP-dependent DNA ligase